MAGQDRLCDATVTAGAVAELAGAGDLTMVHTLPDFSIRTLIRSSVVVEAGR